MNTRFVPLLVLFTSRFLFANSETNVRSGAHNPVVSHIPREHVSSTAIASVGYSKRLHILEVEFSNGRIYRYFEVPPTTYHELISADSKARYYDAKIKGKYTSVHVRPRAKDQLN